MAGKNITVVISQSQGKNPGRRQLEEEIAVALLNDPDVELSLVPHLYDMTADHSGMLFLRSVPGDLIVLAWLYPRAVRWILDRQAVKGHEGITLLKSDPQGEDGQGVTDGETDQREASRGIGASKLPNRTIYCIDLRGSADHRMYLDEIRRILDQNSAGTVDLMQWSQQEPKKGPIDRYLHPERMLEAAKSLGNRNGDPASGTGGSSTRVSALVGKPPVAPHADHLPEPTKRRWYPVIDYSRCSNCLECIDFCLFGVYGLDQQQTILVEQPDSCKKGCPACSRVCPEGAIIFPGHKTPAIAGADGEAAGLKLDLSKLFGAASSLDVAMAERNAELIAEGRTTAEINAGIARRQTETVPEEPDELDRLIDQLDELDL